MTHDPIKVEEDTIEQFEAIYDLYYTNIIKLAEKAKKARKANDYESLQDVRDQIAEGDLMLGPDFKSEALDYFLHCENDRKMCEASTLLEFGKLVGKGDEFEYKTMTQAQAAADLHCNPMKIREIRARRNYEKAKEIENKIEKLVHGISSRLRKYEKLL